MSAGEASGYSPSLRGAVLLMLDGDPQARRERKIGGGGGTGTCSRIFASAFLHGPRSLFQR